MGGARETALASSTYAPFTRRLLTFTGWNWKYHVIIVIKTDLSGFVVPMHSGLCEQYVKSLGLPLGIWLPVSHAPSCIGTTNPSRTGLNPLNIGLFSIWPMGTDFSGIWIKIQQFHRRKLIEQFRLPNCGYCVRVLMCNFPIHFLDRHFGHLS